MEFAQNDFDILSYKQSQFNTPCIDDNNKNLRKIQKDLAHDKTAILALWGGKIDINTYFNILGL